MSRWKDFAWILLCTICGAALAFLAAVFDGVMSFGGSFKGKGHDWALDGDAPVTLVTTTGSVAEWKAARALVRGETEWPLVDTKWTRLYFDGAKSGSAASLNDGSLQITVAGEGTDESPLLSGPNPVSDERFWNGGGPKPPSPT